MKFSKIVAALLLSGYLAVLSGCGNPPGNTTTKTPKGSKPAKPVPANTTTK